MQKGIVVWPHSKAEGTVRVYDNGNTGRLSSTVRQDCKAAQKDRFGKMACQREAGQEGLQKGMAK